MKRDKLSTLIISDVELRSASLTRVFPFIKFHFNLKNKSDFLSTHSKTLLWVGALSSQRGTVQFEKKKMTYVIMTEECSPAVSLQTFKHDDLCTLTFRIYKICIPFSQKCNTSNRLVKYYLRQFQRTYMFCFVFVFLPTTSSFIPPYPQNMLVCT